MNKIISKVVAIFIVAIIAIPVFAVPAYAETIPEIPDYSGTMAVPHPITNKYELASIGNNQFGKEYPLNGSYIQTQDIVFTPEDFQEGGNFYNEGKGWIPIGNVASAEQFLGTYDGGGFTIANIFINRPEEETIGIFGSASNTAVLRNLGNKNGSILGKNNVGGLVGSGFKIIENCHNSGTVTSVAGNAAGISNRLTGTNSRIENCSNSGKIKGTNAAGVLYDLSSNQKVLNCNNSGEIVAKTYAAGVCYASNNGSPVSNCYNTGKVTGQYAGGIVSFNKHIVNNCFNKGEIYGSSTAGGIAATVSGSSSDCGRVEECFNMGIVSGNYASGISNGKSISSYMKISNSYNTGKIVGQKAFGIGDYFTISNCYNAGEVEGITTAGSISFGKGASVNNYFDTEATKLTESSPGKQVGNLVTGQMIGNVAFDNMVGLNTDDKYVLNSNGYPELKTFRENNNPFIKDTSKDSVYVGGGSENPGEPEVPGEDGDDVATASGEIIGTVQPVQIKAVLPTIITFEINPDKKLDYEGADADDAFISPSFSFGNASNISLNFLIENISAKEGMPVVVKQDKYTDEQWQGLGRGDTNANIAFGFKLDDESQWKDITNANSWYGNSAYGFGILGANKQADLHLKGKYGFNWGNAQAKQVTYDVVYKVEAQK